jgi:hypothetical protein
METGILVFGRAVHAAELLRVEYNTYSIAVVGGTV